MLQVREEHVLEVLCAADMYLLSGLKRGCGALLGSCLSTANVVTRLKTARLFQLPQLEDQCIRFISLRIDKVPVWVILLFLNLLVLEYIL
jgi:ankyrin repeat/BTB/POZ domain-containing protein 1